MWKEVDELPGLLRVHDAPRLFDRLTLHNVAGARATKIKNTPTPTGWSRSIGLQHDPVCTVIGASQQVGVGGR
jgi:hypothetical protein